MLKYTTTNLIHKLYLSLILLVSCHIQPSRQLDVTIARLELELVEVVSEYYSV